LSSNRQANQRIGKSANRQTNQGMVAPHLIVVKYTTEQRVLS
jgi:hypothetical protein